MANIIRRSLFLPQSQLPYDRVVTCVIGSTLTPLDIDVKPTNTVVVDIDVVMSYAGNARFFGVDATNRFSTFQYRQTETYFYTGTTGYPYANITQAEYNNRNTWTFKKGGLYINGTLKITSNNNIYGAKPIFIFNASNNGVPYDNAETKTGIKVYGVKVYKNNALVRDMIPVVKNGVGYLYDNVDRRLFAPLTGTLLYEE